MVRTGFCSFYNTLKHCILLGYFAYIKKMEKLRIFNQYHGLTPLEKSQIFDFFNLLFLSVERLFFFVEYSLTHFPGLFSL